MATQTADIVYPDLCSKPLCLCEGAPVLMILQDGVLTTDNKVYVLGTVISVVAESDNSITVTVEFDDSNFPMGFTLEFPVGGTGGTVCAPDCIGDCDWMGKLRRLTGDDLPPVVPNPIVLVYEIVPYSTQIENGTYSMGRMGVTPGMVLTHAVLNFWTNYGGTSFDVVFKLNGATTLAAEHVVSTGGHELTLLLNDIDFDDAMELIISGTVNGPVPAPSVGLSITLIGNLP